MALPRKIVWVTWCGKCQRLVDAEFKSKDGQVSAGRCPSCGKKFVIRLIDGEPERVS